MRWQPTFTTRGGKCTQVNKSPSASRSWISRRSLLQLRPIRPRQRRCSIAPPLGIFQVPQRMLIDVDEFGVTIERCNRKKGWVLKLFRVRKDGHYGHGQKLTVLFAIEPEDPPSPQMYMVAWNIRDGGLGAYGTLVRPTIRFEISVNMCVAIPRSMASPIPMTTVFLFGMIWLPTTAHTSTRRSPHMRVHVVSISSRGRRIIPSLVPLNIKSVISPSRSSLRQSRTGTLLSLSSRSWLLP